LLNTRAVSEVVGALLMIALAVTGGILVYVYSSGLIGSLQGSKAQQPYLEQITLDYYSWNLANSILNLTFRNTGSAQVTLADFFIAGNLIPPDLSNCSGGSLNVNSPAPFCRVALDYSSQGSSFIQGVAYNLRVVTMSGAVFNFACIAGTTS